MVLDHLRHMVGSKGRALPGCRRGNRLWVVLLLLLPVLAAVSVLAASARFAVSFSDMSLWQEKSFRGHTSYIKDNLDGRIVLRARAAGSASGLYRRLPDEVAGLPVLTWSWKIRQTLAAENPYRKEGEDYVARVYLVFPGRFFWQTRALVYVWSDKLPVGTMIPSPYTGNVAVIAVESGNRHAGSWRQEARNYRQDFQAFFHDPPPLPKAVAIMTDTDNTGSEAVAWYGEIGFSSAATDPVTDTLAQ